MAFDPGKDKALVERQENLVMIQIRKQLSDPGARLLTAGVAAIGIYDAKSGRNPQAINAFLESEMLDPAQADAWFNLGSVEEAQHNFTQARMAYQRLLDLHEGECFSAGVCCPAFG